MKHRRAITSFALEHFRKSCGGALPTSPLAKGGFRGVDAPLAKGGKRGVARYPKTDFALASFAVLAALTSSFGQEPSPPAPPVATPPALPEVRLAQIGEKANDAYARAVSARIDELIGRADRVTDSAQRATLLLAAANQVLAYQVEPYCSAKFLELADQPPAEPAIQALARADAILADTETLLAKTPKADPPAGLDSVRHQLETLRIFSSALRAFLSIGAPGEDSAAVREAASGLSALLEDRSAPVAVAAALWQACLREQAGDPERAIAVLDLALEEPKKATLPHAFFARLLRCRLLAAGGGHATALALLVQIEERCFDWIPNEADRANALRATTLVEIQILRAWHTALAGKEATSARQWCADRIAA
ncbi:MAG: hypothetical protein KJ749_12615, partial [Planctomycetes bacterium]|nr:hypothetical protein [Planctomycetota bacterium]